MKCFIRKSVRNVAESFGPNYVLKVIYKEYFIPVLQLIRTFYIIYCQTSEGMFSFPPFCRVRSGLWKKICCCWMKTGAFCGLWGCVLVLVCIFVILTLKNDPEKLGNLCECELRSNGLEKNLTHRALNVIVDGWGTFIWYSTFLYINSKV